MKPVVQSVSAKRAKSNGASSAKVNVVAPVAAPETLVGQLVQVAEAVALIGSAKGYFDALTSFGVTVGAVGVSALVAERETILSLAGAELSGTVTPRGRAFAEIAKAISAGLGKHRDRELGKVLLGNWRKLVALFALVRSTNGTFDASNLA